MRRSIAWSGLVAAGVLVSSFSASAQTPSLSPPPVKTAPDSLKPSVKPPPSAIRNPQSAISFPQAAQDSPLEIIKARDRTIQDILGPGKKVAPNVDRERLKKVINGIFDFRELSRLSLGKYWDQRKEPERAEFTGLFQRLIEQASVKKLDIYKADKIVYGASEVNGDQAVVHLSVTYKKETSQVAYKMHRVDGRWLIYDMVIDDLSMAENYRSSFYKEIGKSSYEKLVEKLRSKIKEEKG